MDNSITVTDMYLVAALFAYGADYVGVDRADKRNQKFHFRKALGIEKVYTVKHGVLGLVETPTFEQVKAAYDTSLLLFPPAYVEAIRRVKGIIHA